MGNKNKLFLALANVKKYGVTLIWLAVRLGMIWRWKRSTEYEALKQANKPSGFLAPEWFLVVDLAITIFLDIPSVVFSGISCRSTT